MKTSLPSRRNLTMIPDGHTKRWMKIRPPCRWMISCLVNAFLVSGLLIVIIYCFASKGGYSSEVSSEDGKLTVDVRIRNVDRNDTSKSASEGASMELCPVIPPNLKGRQECRENMSLEEAEDTVLGVRHGGFWSPSHCHPRWRVAIIVPYRNRFSQMGAFMSHMHNFLQRQELNYSIYIVEQEGDDLFNRARLLNVGFLEAQKEGPWDCFAFHDIDMLPEDDRHLYHCSQQPRHLAVGTSNHNYKLVYYRYFGGACLMTTEQIINVNGWSNIYWGWGGEDDDMWRRIDFSDMKVWRYPLAIARYKTITHEPQTLNANRYKTLARNTGRYPYDGLNSLKYEVRNITRNSLYTHILAYIGSSKDITTFMKRETAHNAQGEKVDIKSDSDKIR